MLAIPATAIELLPQLQPKHLAVFEKNVSRSDGCWLWLAALDQGYGRMRVGNQMIRAHRISFALAGNRLLGHEVLDHLCRNRACVRPDHLEIVSNKENSLRGESVSAVNSRKNECQYGHPLSGDNLLIRQHGARSCRICRAREAQETRDRAKARILRYREALLNYAAMPGVIGEIARTALAE